MHFCIDRVRAMMVLEKIIDIYLHHYWHHSILNPKYSTCQSSGDRCSQHFNQLGFRIPFSYKFIIHFFKKGSKTCRVFICLIESFYISYCNNSSICLDQFSFISINKNKKQMLHIFLQKLCKIYFQNFITNTVTIVLSMIT